MKKNNNFLVLLLLLLTPLVYFAQSKEDKVCLECHGDRTLTTERGGKTVSLFINGKSFAGSIHEDISCIGCHDDVKPDDLPHAEKT